MKTHDLTFASRPAFKLFKKLVYDCRDVVLAPYGEPSRKMKSILVLQLLSNKRVQATRSLAREETALVVKTIRESSGAVNVSAMFVGLVNDTTCRSAFGRKYSESGNGKRFLGLFSDLMELLGRFTIAEFIPWLSWIGRVNGFDKRVDRVAKEMDQVLESMIQERSQRGQVFWI